MTYPAGWDLVNITGTYIGRNGVPCVGSVTLSSPQLVLRSGTIVPAADIVFDLVNGAFSGQIPATDDPNANPTGWVYTVTENVPGGRQGYQIVAPHTSPGIDLSTVVPVTMPMPPTFGFPYVTLSQLAGTAVGDGAYLIGYQNPAAGSVARTVQTKLQEWISVNDFGALGNGSTDDTSAFNAWLSYLGSSGVTGYIPAGTYILSSSLSVTAVSGVSISIMGAGNEVAILQWTSATNGITANIPSGSIWYSPCAFELRGVSLVTTQASTSTVALTVNGNAVSGRSTSMIKVEDCTIRGNSATAQWGNGIDYVDCSQSNTSFVYIFGANQTKTSYGINISGISTGISTQHIIQACQIQFALTAIQVGNYVQGLFVQSCNINQVNYGVSWNSAASAQPELHVNHSQITSLVCGIILSNVQWYVIGDCALNNFANNGICVQADSCILGDIHDNLIYGGGGTTGAIGINITNSIPVTQTGYWQKIHDNQFSQFATGVTIASAASNVIESNNNYSASVTTPITNNSTTSYAGNYLRNSEGLWSTTTGGAKALLLYLGSDNNAYLGTGASGTLIVCGQNTVPVSDNALSSGNASHRWSVIYAGTGTINTSDEREKESISLISDTVLDAWADVEWSQFRYMGGKRTHIGLIAQRVEAAFRKHGLDPFAYGLLCYDKWDAQPAQCDDHGNTMVAAIPAGDRYGIRYEEALALEAALLRRFMRRINDSKKA